MEPFPPLKPGPSHFNFGSKPVLRIVATCLTALLLLLATLGFLVPRPISYAPQPHAYADRVDYPRPQPVITKSEKVIPDTHYNPLENIASSNSYSDDHETGPRIGKVTVLFHSKDETTTRAIKSHEPHNRRFGYPQLILRHDLLGGGTLDGDWNKPTYLLAALLEELRKPVSERLQWLL